MATDLARPVGSRTPTAIIKTCLLNGECPCFVLVFFLPLAFSVFAAAMRPWADRDGPPASTSTHLLLPCCLCPFSGPSHHTTCLTPSTDQPPLPPPSPSILLPPLLSSFFANPTILFWL